MADARIEKLAKVMVNYSLELKPGQTFWLRTTPLAEELNLAVYEEAIKAGAHVFVDQRMPGQRKSFSNTPQMNNWITFPPSARSWWRHSMPLSTSRRYITAAASPASMAPASPGHVKQVQT